MRLCLVNPIAPPATGSRSERTLALVRAFVALGHRVTLLRARLPAGFSPRMPSDPLRAMVSADFEIVELEAGLAARMRFPSSRQVLTRVATRALGEPIWPDPWAQFGFETVRYVSQRASSYDALVASTVPYSSLLAADEICKKTGLPWVADYGDPWSIWWTRRGWRRTIETPIESRLLESAAGVVVTTSGTRDLFLEHFPLDPENVIVVPAGIEARNLGPPLASGPFVLFHAGAVYGPRASIRPFLEALQRHRASVTDGFRLIWGGQIEDPADRELVRACSDEFADHFGSDAVEQLERDSHASIVFGNHGGIQIPAKIWRALGVSRPMLVICADPQDELRRVRELDGRAIVVENTESEIFAALSKLYERLRVDRETGIHELPVPEMSSWLDRAQQYSDLVARRARGPARNAYIPLPWRSMLTSAAAGILGLRVWRRLY